MFSGPEDARPGLRLFQQAMDTNPGSTPGWPHATPVSDEQLGGADPSRQQKLMEANQELGRANVELAQRYADLVDLFDRSPVGYFILDKFGFIIEVNQTGAEMLGVPKRVLCKLPFGSFLESEDLRTFYQHQHLLMRGQERSSCELTLVPRRKPSFPALVESLPSLDEGGQLRGIRLTISDISDRIQLQQQLRQHEKMAALGQLAGGIAHDFNNILLAISATAETLLWRYGADAHLQLRLQRVLSQSDRAALLIRQLLDFGRRSLASLQAVDLVPFLREMAELIQRTLGNAIMVELQTSLPEASATIDPVQIQQVMLNLAINAQHAMPTGGSLKLSLGCVERDEGFKTFTGVLPAGRWYEITVQDSGNGIPATALPHVLEPFFTTKPSGKGTGLGLSQVYGIMQQHEGDLQIASGEGMGTTITLYLPGAVAGTVTVASEALEIPAVGLGQSILVIDDNPSVLASTSELLESLGYHTHGYTDGREAVVALAEGMFPVDLVLSDVVMPHLSDKELIARLHEAAPTVPIILMTGFVPESQRLIREDERISACLEKPFSLLVLANTIASAIHRSCRDDQAKL